MMHRLGRITEAFLKGLYKGSDPLMRKRAEIEKSMRVELAP
jgi:hypothetical protein